MNPQIVALHNLQAQDQKLIRLEQKLLAIPARQQEFELDLKRLVDLVGQESARLDETRSFLRSQERQLDDEETQIREAKNKLSHVKNARELNAAQRELDSTRRMATARAEEIKKVHAGIHEAEQRLAKMEQGLVELRAQAQKELSELDTTKQKLDALKVKFRAARAELVQAVETDLLRQYERIRGRLPGGAFVAAANERCTACKMRVPAQQYVRLLRGEEILGCESCGRLLYWRGHFGETDTVVEEKGTTPKKRAARAEEADAKHVSSDSPKLAKAKPPAVRTVVEP